MKATIVHGNDWEGLYIDGRLRAQGHSLSTHHILEALEIEHDFKTADEEWLDREGYLPVNLQDLREA